MKSIEIIDSHCHIFPQKIARKAAVNTFKFYEMNMEPPFSGTAEDLISQGKQNGISRFVVQSVATSPHQVSGINRFIAAECEKYHEFIGLGSLHPDSETLEADMNEIISLGLHGVKLHPDIQRFKIDDYRCLKIYELCEKHGLPILMHTGDSRFDFSNPNRILPVMEIYTNLTVIGAHLGGWSLWEEASERLAFLPNFYVDCSSSFYALPKEEAKEIILRYGTQKIVFGTDYPMWKEKDELEYLFSLGFSDSELSDILHNNILKIL